MLGYKLLDNNMCAIHGNDMQYELNKIYEMNEEEIAICECGYHFCDNIEDTLVWYHTFDNNRLFEVDTLDGKVIKDYRKNVSNKIKLIREISKEEIREYFKKNVERLVNDKIYQVRIEVARQGYCLDKLVNDEVSFVRMEVANQGYRLDKLINDENVAVRRAVARQGYGLDILIDDENWVVKYAVARQGYGLDILIDDEDPRVRNIVKKILKLRGNINETQVS